MISYLQAIDVIRTFALNHYFVNKFDFEFREQMPNLATLDEAYPLLFVVPIASDTIQNVNEFDIDVYCVDRYQKDRTNVNYVISDCNQTLNDLVLWLEEGQNDIEIVGTATQTPINNDLLDYVGGWVLRLRLQVEKIGLCEIPFKGEQPTPPSCPSGFVRNSDQSFTEIVPSGVTVTLGDITVNVYDQDENLIGTQISPSNIDVNVAVDIEPCPPCADATVTVNGNEFGAVESGVNIDVPVVNSGSNPVGTIDGGQVVIADSFVQINGTTVGDIVAEDSLSIAVELDGVPSGTWNAMDQVWEVESAPCADAIITLNSEPFLTVVSGSTTDITLKDEDGNPVAPIGSDGNTIIVPNAVEWQRPADWLPIPSIANGEQVFYGLFAVYNVVDGNYVAFSFQGNYTVDWGDGVVENFASNVTATHQYSWASVGNVTSEGFRQALIKVTPQVGQNITQVNLQRAHPTLGNGRNSQFIDLVMNIPNVTGTNLTLGGPTIVLHRIVKRVWIKEVGLLTSLGATFSNMTSLESVPLFDTSSVTSFSSTFTVCTSIKVLPFFNTISATTVSSMFNGCASLSVMPLFNTINVTTFASMIAGCILLKQIPQFNTSSANTFQTIVTGCSSLVSLEVNATSITNTTAMFNSTPSLQKVVLNGITRGFSVLGCQMSATALNDLFTSLGTASGSQTITITGNPGASTCNTTIATAKGFTVVI